ncbi:general secretion pathway protein GspB [Vibrio tritonius]|uniref:general secretion pathway protein GspB n=1 Tax=Vibrio tritonius TaxID=1435069 RepID=UPI00315D0175
MSTLNLHWMNTKSGCVALLMIPLVATSSWLTIDTVAQRKDDIHQLSTQSPPIKYVDAKYHVVPYPQFSGLKSTYVVSVTKLNSQQPPLVISHSDNSPIVANTSVPKPSPDEIKESQASQSAEDALKSLDLSKLSLSMKSKVEAAIKSEKRSVQTPEQDQDAMDLRRHEDEYQGILPALNFQTHVYTSDPTRRWVKINGVEYRQGDSVGTDITLVEIKPKSTIIRFKGDLIEIPALYEWRG